MAVDESKLNVFMQSFVQDIGAVMHAVTVVLAGIFRSPKSRLAVRDPMFNLIFEARP